MDKFNTFSYSQDSQAMPTMDMEMPMASISDNERLGQLPLAMAYVPMQQWKEIHGAEVALTRGTIFAELDLPFTGGKGAM